ncbi:MAG TPA: hypothetical protein VFZ53_22480 [Polyangiaceae bacterium]
MRRRFAALVLALSPLASGCLAFARGQAGTAMSTSDTPGHSGPVVGADGVFTLPGLKWVDGESAFPLGFHNSFETVLAPERKDFAWGTGLAYFGSPRPVAGHAIVGTNLHVGEVDGELSFGNISPYAVLGVRASLASNSVATRAEPFLSLDLSGQTYIDYLSDDRLLTTLVCLKFGAGYGF